MDGFFGIGIQELVLIAIVALIVLGPERLPATFRQIARFIRQVRNLTNEFTSQFGDDFKALEDLDPRRILQRELASIDEEEQAKEGGTKGKLATTKPATTAKPTPAKATTPKTTVSSTSTAKTTSTAVKPATSTTAKSGTTTATTTTPVTATEMATAETTASAATETENRIAPPALTPKQETSESASEAATVTAGTAALANGTGPKEAALTNDMVSTAVPVNSVQDHPLAQSE